MIDVITRWETQRSYERCGLLILVCWFILFFVDAIEHPLLFSAILVVNVIAAFNFSLYRGDLKKQNALPRVIQCKHVFYPFYLIIKIFE